MTAPVLDHLAYAAVDEAAAAHAKFGPQYDAPDGTGHFGDAAMAHVMRDRCNAAFAAGAGTWRHILDEEVAEVFAETDPARLRAELIQVAAVAFRWVDAIDARSA